MDFESIKTWTEKLNKTTCESRSKTKETKLRFLNKFMHMHEQARMCIIKPAYTGKIMRTQVSTQKTLKHKQTEQNT